MSHHHHDHSHSHSSAEMSFDERLVKLLEHWIKHNDDHADSYLRWAATARSHQMEEVSVLLERAAGMTREISELFEKAAQSVTAE